MDPKLQQMIEQYQTDFARYRAAHPDSGAASVPASPAPTIPNIPPVETAPRPEMPERPEPAFRPDLIPEIPQPTEPVSRPEIPTLPHPIPEMDAPPRPQNDRGYIQVRTFTASEATPVPDALVLILQEGQLVRQTLTDSDGLTELLALDTVGRGLSMEEGNAQPFTPYDIQITAEGYLPVMSRNVPVFGGVTAIQNVALIPRPEFGGGSGEVIENTEPEL